MLPLGTFAPGFQIGKLKNVKFAKLKNLRLVWRAALAGLLVLICLAALKVFLINREASDKLAAARAENALQDDIPFAKIIRRPLDDRQIQIWQNTGNARAVARFNDSVFAATDGGLIQFSIAGERQKHFTVLDGLPESDLTSLAVFNQKLFIGTASTGLLAFDGERFENYRFKDREAKSIAALLSDAGKLVIGTFAGGLVEFDGSRFREIKPENTRIKSVNYLSKSGEKLFVGTFDNGLYCREAGRWRRFSVAEGLQSNRVVGVAASGENIFVGTDLGVAAARADELFAGNQSAQKIFRPLAQIPALASLTSFQNQILAAQDNGEIFTLDAGKQTSAKKAEWTRPKDLTNARLVADAQDLWLVGSAGAWRLTAKNQFVMSFAPFGKIGKDALSNNIVSALAVDLNGKVWAGTFRNGIDVLTNDGGRLAHLETETLREINFLLPDAKTGKVTAATAAGATVFDRSLRAASFNKSDGLLSNSVAHVLTGENDRNATAYFSTARGLSLQTAGGWRGLTNVNGLPSDNVFTAAFHRDGLFVGTLGGLAQIENGRVARTFKDSNSNLTNNWITALCEADGRLFIGTYGGGALELTRSGELHPFAGEIGKFAVNPNAMFADGARLYVGTLDGVRILDLTAQRWLHLTDELPAKTVLSIAGDAENIYFGTTGGIARIGKNYFSDKQN